MHITREILKANLTKILQSNAKLLYGSECWTLTKEEMRRIVMAETHFLLVAIGYRIMIINMMILEKNW